MAVFKPKYITFDCYGTLINFDMAGAAAAIFVDRVSPGQMAAFTTDFARYRMDEVLGAFKLYPRVVADALYRTCNKWRVECTEQDCADVMTACASWGPHADVPAGLAKVAEEFPLVLLTNSTDELIKNHVPRLGAPIHMTITAEEVGAYKPQMKGFEYMLNKLECGPEEILHVSSSLRYDLMTAHDLGIKHKVWVARGHDAGNPYFGYSEINDIGGLPAVVGL
ncbi:haloacid dehalogenase type II [Erwiniaceae bacterium BAC15a-03b]|uniref:Haloacid dehalogenase type II n=1 Tax=Winslowiella arboricola TaxID=2978220 RepID=A0A9J6PTP6_9GAMM|nr:haloacid dehalogenase type II [Winslowiella arboricola]MCU5772539.1 haloacid dehalogenase type II [Winslowiella arboricola]MCU5779061.1 haloacid dehalogenase type II [Winslowiella arboricola]